MPQRAWGATTQRGDTVFVHVLDWPDPLLALPPLGRSVKSAHLLRGGMAVPYQESTAGVTLQLPPAKEEIDRVVVLIMR